MAIRYLKDTYKPPVASYPIADEIKQHKGPGPKTHAALTEVARRLLHRYPRRKVMLGDAEDCANAFPYLKDADGTIAGINPDFVTVYLTCDSDDSFKRYVYMQMNHWMMDRIAAGDYGRLRDRVETHLNRKKKTYAKQKPLYWLVGGESRRSTVSVRALFDASKTVHVDWPSKEQIEANHERRRHMRYEKTVTENKDGEDKIAFKLTDVRGTRFGKPGQFAQWMLTVFTTAKGALEVNTVANLVVANCPYLIEDNSMEADTVQIVSMDAVYLPQYSNPLEDTTFDRATLDELMDSAMDQYGVNPEDYL